MPMKRIGKPEEVGAAVLFLAADATFVIGRGNHRWRRHRGHLTATVSASEVMIRVVEA